LLKTAHNKLTHLSPAEGAIQADKFNLTHQPVQCCQLSGIHNVKVQWC